MIPTIIIIIINMDGIIKWIRLRFIFTFSVHFLLSHLLEEFWIKNVFVRKICFEIGFTLEVVLPHTGPGTEWPDGHIIFHYLAIYNNENLSVIFCQIVISPKKFTRVAKFCKIWILYKQILACHNYLWYAEICFN